MRPRCCERFVMTSRYRAVVLGSHSTYIDGMLWRSSRGRPRNAPAAFIHPCQPTGEVQW